MKFRKIMLERKGTNSVLSPLESDVLNILWKGGDKKVRDVHTTLKPKRKVALTSVAVILDRLYKKNIVKRKVESCKGGFHYVYSAKISKKDFEQSVIDKTVERLIDMFGPTAVTYFNERFAKRGK